MTADIVNLNKMRKARERAQAEKQAQENRVTFGRTKVEKNKSALEKEARDRLLDGNRIETTDHAPDDDDLDPGSVS